MEWPYPKGLGHYIPVAHKGRGNGLAAVGPAFQKCSAPDETLTLNRDWPLIILGPR